MVPHELITEDRASGAAKHTYGKKRLARREERAWFGRRGKITNRPENQTAVAGLIADCQRERSLQNKRIPK